MSVPCVDEYDAWSEADYELDMWRDWAEMYKEDWENNLDEIPFDLANGNYGDAYKHLDAARKAFDNYWKAGMAGDRLQNGPWNDAVGALDDCIDKHDWEDGDEGDDEPPGGSPPRPPRRQGGTPRG